MKASRKRIPMPWAEYVAKNRAYESKLVANPYALERDGRRREQEESRREDIRREKQAGRYQAGKAGGKISGGKSRREDIGWEKGKKMPVVKIPENNWESNHKCEKVLIIPLHKWYKMHENQMKTGTKNKICTI